MAALAKQDWLEAGLSALGASGISGVRVERLAKQLGVTKGSFYHHFSKREDLLEGILVYWNSVATEQIIDETNAASGSASERLLILSSQVFARNSEHDRIEWAIRNWAAGSPSVATKVADVDSQRIEYVRLLLEESGISTELAEQRAHLLYRVLIGEYTWRQYGGAALSENALQELGRLVLHSD